jgi:hypothetical protein
MRRLGPDPDPVWEPRSDAERLAAQEVHRLCDEEIRAVHVREEYPHFDANDKQIDPGFDYVVVTGVRSKGYFVSGSEYGVHITRMGVIVEQISDWHA